MSRAVSSRGRVIGSVLILALLVWRLGTGPFLQGLRTVDPAALAAAVGIGVLSTLCCAWRWKTLAAGLGLRISLPAATAAYYRSQFLNLTLPGGVLGDVHRGISHGRDARDVARAIRAVILERFAGQVVQLLLTLVVLLALASPVQGAMPLVTIAGLLAACAVVLTARARTGGARSAWTRLRLAATGGTGDRLLARRAWLAIAGASALVVAGHAITFLIAARTAGSPASPSQMLPIALLAMMAMVLPSAGGWGPREGVTAWAFGAAGLGAERGVATGVVYGVMVLVACLPGGAVIVVAWLRRIRRPQCPERHRQRPLREGTAHA